MKMTYSEFLEKLAATPRTWHFGGCNERMIRSGRFGDENYQCPLSAVANNSMDAARETNVGSDELWSEIFNAADVYHTYRKSIRNDLLKACGLDENK